MKLDELAAALGEKRTEIEEIKAGLAALQEEQDRLEQDLFDAIEGQGVRSIKVPGWGTFSLNDLAWAKVTDEAAAREWADQVMPELLLLNRQRLSVLVREHLKGERDALPPGVEYTTSRKIGWRKS